MNADVKQCCARLYESELVTRLLGDSFHPGGAALTERLGTLLQLTPEAHVLDVAAGRGAGASTLARRFGCRVTGVDLSEKNIALARTAATDADKLTFVVADAESLPLADASVDAIVCECAFCTFPNKQTAAREFARVLKPRGRLGMSDLTRTPGSHDEFADLMSWIACLAGAMRAADYGEWLTAAGFRDVVVEPHDQALLEIVADIGKRLFVADVLARLDKIDISGVDLPAAKRLARQALEAIHAGRLGYAIVCATNG
jgi:ubiquinone/menaquinone biosynthesis C-methylase UbiE